MPPCLPCCNNTPVPIDCICALILPPVPLRGSLGSTYANRAAAAAAIAGNADSCLGYWLPRFGDGNVTLFDASALQASGLISTAVDSQPIEGGNYANYDFFLDVALKAGSVLNAKFVTTITGAGFFSTGTLYIALYKCDGTFAVDHSASYPGAGTQNRTVTVPADGEYIIWIGMSAVESAPFTKTTAVTLSCTNAMVFNPVVALWNDSGDTRKLWACPKMLLPPLVESVGTWYASCADAHTAIASFVSNCVGYCEAFTTFTATDGGSSLTFAGNNAGAGLNCWGSINLLVAGKITATFSNALGGFFVVYDDTGTVVAGGYLGPGPFTTPVLPPGRYIVNAEQAYDMTHPAGNMVITASVSMSVNQIQALYATEPVLACAARLNCGDACL